MFSEELRKQARGAKSVQELRTMANERGIEMSAESAEKYYAALHPHSGVVADDELANVTGGGCGDPSKFPAPLFRVGDSVIYAPASVPHGEAEVCGRSYSDSGSLWEYQLKMKTGRRAGDTLSAPEDWLQKC